jgi:hypothetical protein
MHSTGQTVTQLPSRTHKLVIMWVIESPSANIYEILVALLGFVKLEDESVEKQAEYVE